MRPYFEGNGVTLYLEDCVKGMSREVPTKTIDVVVTSPPYNVGIEYGHYRDKRPRAEYLEWIEEVGAAVRAVLSDEGSFFLNVGGIPRDPWLPMDIAQRFRKRFILQNVFHWIKSIAITKEDSAPNRASDDVVVGHYKPIGGRKFVNDCHEYVFHFTKTGDVELDRLAVGVPYKDKSNVARWNSAGSDLRCRGNAWFIPYQTIWNREVQRPHPSTFPIALPEMCMKIHGLQRITRVMDPFMGIGTTAIASVKLQKQCIGFEVDREYLREAALRIEELETSSAKSFRRDATSA